MMELFMKFDCSLVRKYVDLFYEKYCENKQDVINLNKNEIEEIACVASHLAYRSSVSRAKSFNNYTGINLENDKQACRFECENKIIKVFLVQLFYHKITDFEEECQKTWQDIKKIYHDKYFFLSYKIGHAQKWLSMSIKYFYVLLVKFNQIEINVDNVFNGYWYFPVDGMVINHFKNKDWNLKFTDLYWTKSDSVKSFSDFLEEVKNHKLMNVNPFIYELCIWWDIKENSQY